MNLHISSKRESKNYYIFLNRGNQNFVSRLSLRCHRILWTEVTKDRSKIRSHWPPIKRDKRQFRSRRCVFLRIYFRRKFRDFFFPVVRGNIFSVVESLRISRVVI